MDTPQNYTPIDFSTSQYYCHWQFHACYHVMLAHLMVAPYLIEPVGYFCLTGLISTTFPFRASCLRVASRVFPLFKTS